MWFRVSKSIIRPSLIIALTVTGLCNQATAENWLGSLLKPKRAKAAQPALVNVPGVTPVKQAVTAAAMAKGVNLQRSATDAVTSVTASAKNAVNAAAGVSLPSGIRPSQIIAPIPLRPMSNDQYLGQVLHQAQARPTAAGAFAQQFPELSSGYRRKKLMQPLTNATSVGGVASWMAHGTPTASTPGPVSYILPQTITDKAISQPTAVAGGQPAAPAKPAAESMKTVQVNHERQVEGQTLAEYANISATNETRQNTVSPTQAVQTGLLQAGDLKQLPEGAQIVSVQDRVVKPADIPAGATLNRQVAAISPDLEAPTHSTSPAVAMDQTPVHLTPEQLKNLPPGTTIIPANAAATRVLNGNVQSPTVISPAPIGMNVAQMNQLPPGAEIISTNTAHGFPNSTIISGGVPVQGMHPQRMHSQSIHPQIIHSTPQPAPGFPRSAVVIPRVTTEAPVTSQMRPSFATSHPAATMDKNMVALTLDQVAALPPGTRIRPANASAAKLMDASRTQNQAKAMELARKQQVMDRERAELKKIAQEREALQRAVAIEKAKLSSIRQDAMMARQNAISFQQAANAHQQAVNAQQQAGSTQNVGLSQNLAAQLPAAQMQSPRQVASMNAQASATRPAIQHNAIPNRVSVASPAALPPANVAPAVSQSSVVEDRLNRAFELSNSNPTLAEEEYVDILRYIAKAHDDADGTQIYAQALERGLLTLDEAEQVKSTMDELGEEAAMQMAHSLRSDVSKSFANGKLPADELMDAYHLYARHSMMIAIGKQKLGSQALYGWGQLVSSRTKNIAFDAEIERPKALALLNAALDADKTNWRVHNELGVIHAREGQYVKAEKALRKSLALNPQDETYHNMAMVFETQGKNDLASQARTQAKTQAGNSSRRIVSDSSRTGTAQVSAESAIAEPNRRDRVQSFVDRILGNDKPPTSYEDDAIPLQAR